MQEALAVDVALDVVPARPSAKELCLELTLHLALQIEEGFGLQHGVAERKWHAPPGPLRLPEVQLPCVDA